MNDPLDPASVGRCNSPEGLEAGQSFATPGMLNNKLMLLKIAAIFLFACLIGLSGIGNPGAFGTEAHCSHAVSAMRHVAAAEQQAHPECGHSARHAPNACAMNGMCSAAGCFLALALNSPAQWADVQALRFHPAIMLTVDGLAHPPPLEPPRA